MNIGFGKKIAFVFAVLIIGMQSVKPGLTEIDFSNIPKTVEILEKTEAEIQREVRKKQAEAGTLPDLLDIAYLTLFGFTPKSSDITPEKLAARFADLEKKLLLPGLPHNIEHAAATLFKLIITAKTCLDARLERLVRPSRYPPVKYPEELFSLSSAIDAFAKCLKPPTRTEKVTRNLGCALALNLSAVSRGGFGSGASDKKTIDDSSSTEEEARPTKATRARPRRVERTETQYRVFDYCVTIYGEEETRETFLLIAVDDDGEKTLYYPAYRNDSPATANDFATSPEEIIFVELTFDQQVRLFELFMAEGVTQKQLKAAYDTLNFPSDSEELFDATCTALAKKRILRTTFTQIKPYTPPVAASRAKMAIPKRAPFKITNRPGTMAATIKLRTFVA